jgi:hypothetical protein
MARLLNAGAAAVIAMSVSPHAFAICGGDQPASMQVGTILNCPDYNPIGTFLAAVGSASTINNNGIGAICQDQNGLDGAGYPCLYNAGISGDARVYIQFNWARQVLGAPVAPLGCPNPEGLPNVGRNFVQMVCNNGSGAILTTSYDPASAGYNFDFASKYDPASGDASLTLSTSSGLRVVAMTLIGGNYVICFDESTPIQVFSDCDPDSLATQFGVSCPDTTPTVGYGANFYSTTGPRPPTDLRVSAWTLRPATAGPGGSQCATMPSTLGSSILWVGTTAVVGGQDTGAIATWIPIIPMAAIDGVRVDSAAFVHGRLDVSFSTTNETLIVGFNVYAGSSTKLNATLIPAQGTGSNAYTFAIGRGAVKSDRTVTVEAVKRDGTVERSAALTVK